MQFRFENDGEADVVVDVNFPLYVQVASGASEAWGMFYALKEDGSLFGVGVHSAGDRWDIYTGKRDLRDLVRKCFVTEPEKHAQITAEKFMAEVEKIKNGFLAPIEE